MISRRAYEPATGGAGGFPRPASASGGLMQHKKQRAYGTSSLTAYRLLAIAGVLYLILALRIWLSRSNDAVAGDVRRVARSVFSFGEGTKEGGSRESASPQEEARINHVPVRSDTGLFVTMGSYIIDGDASAGSNPSRSTDDLILLIVGVGDFTKTPQPSKEAAMKIPPKVPEGIRFILRDTAKSKVYEFSNVVFHSNGTAYQGKISPSRGALWFGERAVWISCAVPKEDFALQQRLVTSPDSFSSSVVIVTPAREKVFDSGFSTPSLMLSTSYPRPLHNLTLCSSAIYGLTGTKWIIEWIEYHRAAGFDSMDLYVHKVGPLVTEVLDTYVADNSPRFFVRLHDWTTMIDNGPIGFNENTGVGRGVQGDAWEHGQRLTRNDCFLRNRGRSKWIMFSDVDELFTSKMPGLTVWDGPISSFCEKSFQENEDHIACSFSSVTTPPNAKSTDESLLLLERIDTSEASCQTPYNCGRFHYGREKYAIRTARGTLNPNSPFFYHAISQNYDISEKHHVLVPSTLGVVRHYAGHFSHSRKGGLSPSKALFNPLQPFIIAAMRRRIYSAEGLGIKRLYAIPGQSESFLKLDWITDLWRFAKPGERPEELPQDKVDSEASGRVVEEERYMTFEYFGGRLNNQLWTLDWVFRVALALNRTAVIGDPLAREHYIGFPSSADDASLWDIGSLRNAPFKFKFAWEIANEGERALVFGDKSQLPAECVWEFAESRKHLMYWASKTGCTHRRIHFSSGNGLVHSYKADTRKYGVDPLIYWKHMRLHPQVISIIQRWWKTTKPKRGLDAAIGLHFRSWREANGDAAHALKVCTRLSQKLLGYAAKRFDALQRKCDAACRDASSAYVDVQRFWRENEFDVTCLPATIDRVKKICGNSMGPVEKGEVDFFVATDHETEEADAVFQSLNAKMMPSLDTDDFISRFVEMNKNGLTVRKYARSILPILLDVSALTQVGRFFGSPASTLSQAVCLWRRAMGMKEEVPGMCQLVWYSTFSDVCEEICF